MDSNIDVNRRKPRRTEGTPSYYYRNRFAVGCIVFGIAIFTAFACTPVFRVANEKYYKAVSTETEEERDRKYLFSNPAPRRGVTILKTIEEQKEMNIER